MSNVMCHCQLHCHLHFIKLFVLSSCNRMHNFQMYILLYVGVFYITANQWKPLRLFAFFCQMHQLFEINSNVKRKKKKSPVHIDPCLILPDLMPSHHLANYMCMWADDVSLFQLKQILAFYIWNAFIKYDFNMCTKAVHQLISWFYIWKK